ncbi:MAG: hypothetical protein WCL44_14195 [bacterium]
MTAGAVSRRLTAFLVLSAILWLGTTATSVADVWTGRVVNGWTFQIAFPPTGQSLTNAAVQPAFDNVRSETDYVTDFGALAMHNAWAAKNDTIPGKHLVVDVPSTLGSGRSGRLYVCCSDNLDLLGILHPYDLQGTLCCRRGSNLAMVDRNRGRHDCREKKKGEVTVLPTGVGRPLRELDVEKRTN